MKNEIEQIAQQNKMSIEFVTWFFNEKKSACGEHWFLMLGAMWEGWKGRSIEIDRLAAENVALKAACGGDGNYRNCPACTFSEYIEAPETPATDRIVAGIKADGVTAALESCSDYLDTDCVMDRLDISYEEAEKRTSGAIEFHDAMVNFANQLREGPTNDQPVKACPFCGSNDVEAFAQDEDDCPYRSAIVRCHSCDAQSAQMVGSTKIEMAIRAWNKRVEAKHDN